MKSFKRRILLFFIGGFAAVIIGAIVGMFIGALFGGMLTAILDVPRFYGGLPGYEGTGALGLVLGSTFSVLFWIRMRLQGNIRRTAYIILTVTAIINFIAQNLVWMKPGWNLLPFLPIVFQILLFFFYKQEEF